MTTAGKEAKDTLPLVYQLTIAEGQERLVADFTHPLTSPLRHGAMTGKPVGPWQYVCVRHGRSKPPTVLGALMLTVAGRLLFFPGCAATLGRSLGHFGGRQVDHITLDPPDQAGRWRSHVTLRDDKLKNKHGLPNSARQRDGAMLPWLSLIAPDLSGFDPLPHRLSVPLEWNNADVPRYAREAIGANYQQAGLVDEPPMPPGGGFWQVDFFVALGPEWKRLRLGSLRYQGEIDDVLSYSVPSEDRVAGVLLTELRPGVGAAMVVTRPSGSATGFHFVTPPDDWIPD